MLLSYSMEPLGSSHVLPAVGAEQPELDEAGVSNEEAASAIRDSCLVPFMEAELGQASFTDMGNRCAARRLLCISSAHKSRFCIW